MNVVRNSIVATVRVPEREINVCIEDLKMGIGPPEFRVIA
jgi:hypothetical protein